MNEYISGQIDVIEQACASVVANLSTHQQIQKAISDTKEELDRLSEIEMLYNAEQSEKEKAAELETVDSSDSEDKATEEQSTNETQEQ